jgi:putative DNA methylase
LEQYSLKKKLIEVALPLEAINAESSREKSIRHGHPSTLHLWWARRPLAAARAVIWSSLVDDPSSLPERFPTEAAQTKERDRLFGILERLVKWENSNNKEVLDEAKAEIMKSTNGNLPALLDPFAGGGSIPLEAQRLGLEAHANDLNPVAVMINKAMIEIPPKFAGRPPVNPNARSRISSEDEWEGARGLAEDVHYYGDWMKNEAFKRIGHLYPKVKVPKEQGGGEATVIVWIWARTVKCPNPACGCEMPLVHSFELSKKRGKEAYVEPVINNGQISYVVKQGKGAPEGTVNRKGAKCICCGTPVAFPYIREEGQQGRMGSRLIAIVAEGNNGRIYLSPNDIHVQVANTGRPSDYPDAVLPHNPRDFKTPNYGLKNFSDLFTPANSRP